LTLRVGIAALSMDVDCRLIVARLAKIANHRDAHSFAKNANEWGPPASYQNRMCYIVLMASTRSATLSIRLKPETKKRLAKLAQNSGRSSNFLISDAVDSYVAEQEMLAAEIRQGNRQVAAGHYIRHEDMKAWLLSWGTDHELPVPRCACGKEHDDETLCR
jgi:predicted transcriptional regulator